MLKIALLIVGNNNEVYINDKKVYLNICKHKKG